MCVQMMFLVVAGGGFQDVIMPRDVTIHTPPRFDAVTRRRDLTYLISLSNLPGVLIGLQFTNLIKL